MSKITFYDRYHQKNKRFYKVIRRNNFTYYHLLNILHQHFPSFQKHKVLDVGSGVGTVSLYLATEGAQQVDGIDVSPRAIELSKVAQQAIGVKNVQFTRGLLKKGTGKYDVALCLEVIEHIEDDAKFLQLLHSQLKKNGSLVLSTPLSENLLYGLGFYKKFDHEVGHLRRYTVSGLKKLIEKSGFKVVEMYRTEGILRNILFTTQLGFLIRFIRGPLVPVFHAIDSALIPLFGAVDVTVVARKV